MCASDNINFSLRLKPIDVKFMKMLHEKVNIVPVIGKADSLTKNEIAKLKKRVCFYITLITFKYFNVHCIFICFWGNVRFWGKWALNSILFYHWLDILEARAGLSLHVFFN